MDNSLGNVSGSSNAEGRARATRMRCAAWAPGQVACKRSVSPEYLSASREPTWSGVRVQLGYCLNTRLRFILMYNSDGLVVPENQM